MQLVPAGVALPFEVTYYDPNLDVGMVVMDVTTGSPVQVGDVIPMTVAFSNTYYAKFTPENGHSYVLIKSVYTDNTFDTIAEDYAQGSESIYAQYFKTQQTSLVGVVQC